MKNTLGANQAVGETAYLADEPSENDDLHTMSVVDMDVHRGDDVLAMFVLNVCEPTGELTFMVIINDRESPHRHDLVTKLFCYELVTNEIAKGFRSVRDPAIFKETIKSFEEMTVD